MANFVFVLSKGDVESATRCFQFAEVAHSKGHNVDLFFVDDGVLWANSAMDFTAKTSTGDCPKDYLPYLVENEVTIGV
jgi:sulfur relay (sulfurtransferase) complex TusBCD TusD component (DsrE family)